MEILLIKRNIPLKLCILKFAQRQLARLYSPKCAYKQEWHIHHILLYIDPYTDCLKKSAVSATQ
jgi:hypothetical protein